MIDFTKPVRTVGDRSKPSEEREHLPVEIKFTDGRGDFPVNGYIGNNKYKNK